MTPQQLKQREVLLARNDAILDRWPERTGPEFIREMTAVLQGLEALAREADAVGGDRLERCRTWRYVGNAFFDLGAGRDLAQLKHAADAYQRAEALLEGLDDPIERMKLDYSYGNALFHLSDAQDLQLAQQARRRYASALTIARVHMPAGVESAQSALKNAEMVVALLQAASGLSHSIAELKEDLGKPDSAPAPAQSQDIDWMGMLEELRDVYNKDVEAGKVTETREQALDPVLEQLQDILQHQATDLTGMTSQGQSVRDLMGSMEPLLHKTSQPAAPAAGSRADQVWQRFSRLKTYLARDLSRPHMGSEERFYEVELYKRCGYADTYLHQQERDDATVRAYEADVLRQLAHEVRAFSMRNHLTLASPVWGSAPQPQDPSAVFFSGGNALRQILAEACEGLGLKLLAQTMPKDFAATRWDQLRRSYMAVFDYTTYIRPDLRQTSDLAVTGPIAAVSYELGIALTLGKPIIVVAKDNQQLPFDVDIEPVRLRQDGLDRRRLGETINEAMYGQQWAGGGSSIAATRAYLQQAFSGHENFIVRQSLKLIDDAVARDPVQFRHFVEPVLGSVGPGAPLALFPAWPGSYPKAIARRLFHVTAFGPNWAGDTMSIAAQACSDAQPAMGYIRGDQVLDPDIIRSIWDNLCQATHVVVDLTGLNANVALELGIAHTLGRNVLMVTQDHTVKEHLLAIAKMRLHRYSLTVEPNAAQLGKLLSRFLAMS